MSILNTNTISRVLSGSTILNNSPIKVFITAEAHDGKNTLADFAPLFTSNSVTVTSIRTNNAFHSTDGMVYLSAYKVSFPNITTDFSSTYNIRYITYIDSGTANTSYILTVDEHYSPVPFYGPTDYYFNNISSVFSLRDSNQNKFLFRHFRHRLMTGGLGNLQQANIKVALIDNTYDNLSNINTHQYYSDIYPNVVGIAPVPGIYIHGKSLKSSTAFIAFPNLGGNTGKTVAGAAFYIDSGDPATSTLIGYYSGSTYLVNTPYTSNGSTVTLKLYSGGTIFEL